MAIITIVEIINLILTTIIVGYIFTGYIPNTTIVKSDEDPLIAQYTTKYANKWFDWKKIKFAILVASPGIILHELGHKFVALYFGLSAQYQIFWGGLLLGLVLKLLSSPFLILAPGYVVISGNATILQSTLIAFAGPFVNLILWLGSWYILKTNKKMTINTTLALTLMKQINMVLFFFNMIPIPPFDGFTVWTGLYHILFH